MLENIIFEHYFRYTNFLVSVNFYKSIICSLNRNSVIKYYSCTQMEKNK